MITSYINGNISTVKQDLENSPYSLGELLEYYVLEYKPSMEAVILFVKRLGSDC